MPETKSIGTKAATVVPTPEITDHLKVLIEWYAACTEFFPWRRPSNMPSIITIAVSTKSPKARTRENKTMPFKLMSNQLKIPKAVKKESGIIKLVIKAAIIFKTK